MKKRNRFWAGVLCLALVFSLLGTLFVQAEEPLKYTSDTLEIYVTNGKTEVKISNLAASFEGKTILCAWYGEDMLMDVRYGLYQSPGISMVSDIKHYDAIRLFYWDSFGNMTPLSAVTAVVADRWAEESDSVKVFSWDDLAKAAQTDSTTQDVTLFFYDETGQEAMCLVSKNADFIYNGVTTSPLDITVADFFSDEEILRKNTYLGSITLLEYNENQAGFDGVEVELGVSSMIDLVSSDGTVDLKKSVNFPEWRYSYFGSSSASVLSPEDILSVTEHGVTYDAKWLKAGDVVVVKPTLDAEKYTLDKADGGSFVIAQITDYYYQPNAFVTLSTGNTYPVAGSCYADASFALGQYGRFCIYEGKILSFEHIFHANYAFVLGGSVSANKEVSLEVLEGDGAVRTYTLAEKPYVSHLYEVDKNMVDKLEQDLGYDVYENEFVFTLDKCSEAVLTDLVNSITNHLISYETDEVGAMEKLSFEQKITFDDAVCIWESGSGIYQKKNNLLDRTDVGPDTKIFFIGGGVTYGSEAVLADKGTSKVGGVEDLNQQTTYTYIAFGPDLPYAQAVVITQTAPYEGEIEPEEEVSLPPVAVINSVTSAAGETVVSYYMEEKEGSATVKADAEGAAALATAQCGDVFALQIADGVVEKAIQLLTFDRGSGEMAYQKGQLPKISYLAENMGDHQFYYGVAYKTGVGFIRIHCLDAAGLSNSYSSAKELEGTRTYLYDPEKTTGPLLTLGSMAKVSVDEELTEPGMLVDFGDESLQDITISDGTEAYGLMDTLFVHKVNGTAVDVVVYKAYNFDYYVDYAY